MTDTTGQLNSTGAAFKASGYFGYTSGKTTIAYNLNDFTGRIYLEASLATTPSSTDWFTIKMGDTLPYVQYPLNPTAPTGTTGDTGSFSYTFQSCIVWIRLRVDRSYLINPSVGSVGNLQVAYMNF
jgi:hypothetical protein